MSRCACGSNAVTQFLFEEHRLKTPQQPAEVCTDWGNCGFVWGVKDE